MIETLTEWKAKLQVGTQIRQIWVAHQGGEVDYVYTVSEVQTNGVYMVREDLGSRRVWMEFPKRKDIEFTEHGWIRFDRGNKLSENIWHT